MPLPAQEWQGLGGGPANAAYRRHECNPETHPIEE